MELLKEEMLEQVSGGKAGEFFSVNLIGPYWIDCDGSGSPNNMAKGWSNLKAECVYPSKPCPYRISDNDGPIGWTKLEYISLK